MSKPNLATETFGDISMFVHFKRGTSTPVDKEAMPNPFTSTSGSEGQLQTPILSDDSNIRKSPDSASTETSFETGKNDLVDEDNLNDRATQVEKSETESILESWSGPEISSGPDSWGNSEQGSSNDNDMLNKEAEQTMDPGFNDIPANLHELIGENSDNSENEDFTAGVNSRGEGIKTDDRSLEGITAKDENDTFDGQDDKIRDFLHTDQLPLIDSSKTCENISDEVPNLEDEHTSTVNLDVRDEEWFDIDLNDESSGEELKTDTSTDEFYNGDKNSLGEAKLHQDIDKEENRSNEYSDIEDEATDGQTLSETDVQGIDKDFNGPFIPEENENFDGRKVLPDEKSDNDDNSSMSIWSNVDLNDEDDSKPNEQDHADNISTNSSQIQVPNVQVSPDRSVVVEMSSGDERSLDIREEGSDKGYTILEVWCWFAMIFGAIPYWILNDGRTTIVKRTTAINIIWTTSMVLSVIEIMNVIPKLSSILKGEQDGNAYLHLGNHIAFALSRFLFAFMAVFGSKFMKKANNLIISFPHLRMTTLKTAICLVALTSYAICNTLLYIWFQTELKFGFTDVTSLKILQRLECFGKMHLTVSIKCSHSSNISFGSIAWAAIGVVTTAHKIFTETVICLGILIFCATLLYTTFDIDGTEVRDPENEFAHVTPNDLSVITNLADELSHFIGEALLGYLLYNATETAKMTLKIFSASSSVYLSLVLRNGIVFIGLFMGSLATARINRISDAITSAASTIPHQSRPGTAILLGYIHDLISRKSIGIIVAGMFVITYKITFSYMGLIGTLITLLKFPHFTESHEIFSFGFGLSDDGIPVHWKL